MTNETDWKLAPLLEVPCVEGGFFVGATGQVDAAALSAPALATFGELRGKFARLRGAFLLAREHLDFCIADVGRWKLCLTAGAGGILCVVIRTGADLDRVRLAARETLAGWLETPVAA